MFGTFAFADAPFASATSGTNIVGVLVDDSQATVWNLLDDSGGPTWQNVDTSAATVWSPISTGA